MFFPQHRWGFRIYIRGFFFPEKPPERFVQVRNADSFVAAQCGESLGWTADVEESLMTLTGF